MTTGLSIGMLFVATALFLAFLRWANMLKIMTSLAVAWTWLTLAWAWITKSDGSRDPFGG